MSTTTHWHEAADTRCKTGNTTDNPNKVDCKRCLKALDAETTKALEGTPDAPASNPDVESIQHDPDLQPTPSIKDKAKAAATKARTTTTKAPKQANLHLAFDGTKTGTRCNIPGATTTDAEAVTCKVCRSLIDGTKPSNAISDDTKKARKAFSSFKARIGYMLYMDAPAHSEAIKGIRCEMTYTALNGVQYTAITDSGSCSLMDSEENQESVHGKGGLEDAIRKLGWEA
jgi:hypothetical protein